MYREPAAAAPWPRSWYAASARPWTPRPPLTGEAETDVAVVGGGFTGLSSALELAERGYRVTLLEAARIGFGASGRNGGHIATGYNPSMAAIERLVGREDAGHLWQLYEGSKALIAQRVARHRIDCDLRWGYLLAAVKPRHQRALAGTLTEWRERYGYPYGRLLDRDETRAMVDSPRYVGGLFDEGGGQLHPLNYALGLAGAAEAAGARLHEGTAVVDVTPGDRPVCRTPQGRLRARVGVVLAGNAYLHPPSPAARRIMRARIMPVGTYMIATEPLGAARARALIPADVAVADLMFVLNYYRLSADRRLLFGGLVNYSGVERAGLMRRLRRTMLHYFPGLADLAVDHAWGGNVAITRNRLPHLGRLDRNILFAQGFSGNGVALTGMAGRVMAEALAAGAERFDVFARLPHGRFPGGRALRVPALVLAMAWLRLRDLLG